MKRLYYIVLMVLGIAVGSRAQTDALVIEQNNGLADILKVTANLRIENNTDGTISIKDGENIVSTYARTNIKQIAFDEETALIDKVERAALIALYNATDGDNWKNNTNWCSDKPLSEWYGIETRERHVTRLKLYENNLKGTIPINLGNLSKLEYLHLSHNNLNGVIPVELANLKELQELYLHYNKLTGIIPNELGNIRGLQELNLGGNKLTGPIPEELGNLIKLRDISLGYNQLTGDIPSSFSNLINLTELDLSSNNLVIEDCNCLKPLTKLSSLTLYSNNMRRQALLNICSLSNLRFLDLAGCKIGGTIPAEIGNLRQLKILRLNGNGLTGEIPSEMGNLTNLIKLDLSWNKLTGEIPETFNNLTGLISYSDYHGSNIYSLVTYKNLLSGKIPSLFHDNPDWSHEWPFLMFNSPMYDLEEVYIPAPSFHVTDIDGNILDSGEIYPKNKYTAIFHWATWCTYSNALMKIVIPLYEKYRDYGFEIIGLTNEEQEETIRNYMIQKGIKWRNFISEGENIMDYHSSFATKGAGYPASGTPEISLIDSNGRVVFTDCINERNKITDFLRSKLGEGNPIESYTSTDYSADGNINMLQRATTEKNIKVVIMGDGFTDRMIADGSYDAAMQKAQKALFSAEPMKSLRNQFTVMSVTAVSENEYFGESYKTAFSGYFGEGTLVGGNNSKVFEYAKKAISEDEIDDAIIIVIMNEERWAGTCYMYHPEKENTWGSGATIAYVPNIGYTGIIEYETFESLLSHEAVGHGFAKLGDEYINKVEPIPAASVEDYKAEFSSGWWKNVDFTSNPVEVKWSEFISDERYADESIGIYEGGLTYPSGVYRPTDNSIMSSRATNFNAPSRQAIWYRINKLTQGANWEGTYEDFVQFDKATYGAQAPARRAQNQTDDSRALCPKDLKTAPPVVKTITWREEK